MPCTEAEDLLDLKAKEQQIKNDAFALMREYLRMPAIQLVACGHKSPETAIRRVLETALADIKKATDVFLRRWPD